MIFKAKQHGSSAEAVGLLLCMTALGNAFAQSYPVRPIRLIVPFAPGGGVDFVSRALAQRLSESLGQAVVVDNRAGAGGIVGAELAARATPDGYTLVMGNNSTHAVLPAVTPKIPYDSIRDFTPISLIAETQNLLVASSALPARSVKEFIELAKARPDHYNYGSAGKGSQTHLAGELFKHVTGVKLTHIPYKGAGPGYTALLAGEIHVMFGTMLGSLPHVQSGRLRALAITGEKRSQVLPAVATLLEQGAAGFEPGLWYALLGPRLMPAAISSQLHEHAVKAVRSAELRKVVVGQGSEPVGSTPAQCAAAIKTELDIWTKLVKEARLQEQL